MVDGNGRSCRLENKRTLFSKGTGNLESIFEFFFFQFVRLAIHNCCFIQDGNRGAQALRMMKNVKVFMSQRELEDPVFTKLKNVVNSVIEHFEQQQPVVQGGSNAR